MSAHVTLERDGPVLLIGVNRPEKRNAWNPEIIRAVAQAYSDLAGDDELRVGVVFGHGDDFTAGLDLPAVAPLLAEGRAAEILPADLPDPWDFMGEPCPKPVVVAVQGRCYTLGIELILASQVAVAAEDTVFAQLEVARGIVPLGGATFRLPRRLGGAGLRYLLSAEQFTASTAHRLGLVQEVVPVGEQLVRAVEIAQRIAANAPLGVQAALASARAAERAARDASADAVRARGPELFASDDATEAVNAMLERREPIFRGR